MATLGDGARRLDVVDRYRTGHRKRNRLVAVDEMPIGLILPGIDEDAAVAA